jgi:acyl carrier protein
MSPSEVSRRVCEIVAESFDLPPEEVTVSSSAEDIPAWDSLQHAILLIRLQHGFGVEILPSRAHAGRTVRDVTALVTASLSRKPALN